MWPRWIAQFREMGGGDNPAWIAIDDTPMPECPEKHVVYTVPHQGLKAAQVQEAIEKIRQQI